MAAGSLWLGAVVPPMVEAVAAGQAAREVRVTERLDARITAPRDGGRVRVLFDPHNQKVRFPPAR